MPSEKHAAPAGAIAHSPKRAAVAIDSSQSEVYSLLQSGQLKAKKLGRRTLIPDAELRRLIDGLPDYQPGTRIAVRKEPDGAAA